MTPNEHNTPSRDGTLYGGIRSFVAHQLVNTSTTQLYINIYDSFHFSETHLTINREQGVVKKIKCEYGSKNFKKHTTFYDLSILLHILTGKA